MSKQLYHTHHIIPKHFGGTNDPSNLIKLTISEHAAWHYELWVYWGKTEDWLAWKGLSGCISKEEIRRLAISNATKGKTYEEIHGKEKALQLKQQRKLAMQGKPKSPEHIEKHRQAIIGKKASKETLIKLSNKWEITDPNNNMHIVINLRQFCRDNNLDQGNMVNQSLGKIKTYKGWKVKNLGSCYECPGLSYNPQ